MLTNHQIASPHNKPLKTDYSKITLLKYLTSLFSSKYLVYLTSSSAEDRKFVLYDFSQNIISGWRLMFTFVQRIQSWYWHLRKFSLIR